jgi:hypothetical protein
MENSELQTIFSALQTGPFADMARI